MEELENKIREALPRLKSLTDGAIVYRPHWNVFKQEYDEGVYDELELRNGYLFEDDEKVDSYPFCIGDNWYVGHPIKLNDVLEYWKKKSNTTSATGFKNELHKIVMDWDLSSVFLADQSEELKDFLNGL